MPHDSGVEPLVARARALGVAGAIAITLGVGAVFLGSDVIPDPMQRRDVLIAGLIASSLAMGFSIRFVLALRALMGAAADAEKTHKGVCVRVRIAFALSVVSISAAGIGSGLALQGGYGAPVVVLTCAIAAVAIVFRSEAWIGRYLARAPRDP